MTSVRLAAVAGMFYPDNPQALQQQLQQLLAGNMAPGLACNNSIPPRALVVPHAGYIYSGPIAATAYNTLAQHARQIRRVVLLGPAHRVAFRGIALSQAATFVTPLGNIVIDAEAQQQLLQLQIPQVGFLEQAHTLEHSLEVQLPFLQTVLHKFSLVPLVVGDVAPATVQQVIEHFALQPDTLIVVSTDLSHYMPYAQAVQKDHATIAQIEHYSSHLQGEQACGCRVLNGFLLAAQTLQWHIQLLDYRNSGDTAGSKDKVVGYAAFIAH